MHMARTHTCPPRLQAVPANLTRYGLSQIINHLLALGEPLAAGRRLPPCCWVRHSSTRSQPTR